MKTYMTFLSVLIFTACGLENPIVNAITHDNSKQLPDVQDNVIHGVVADGSANITAAIGGRKLDGISATAEKNGEFMLHLPGVQAFTGLLLSASAATGQFLNLVPYVPKQRSVFNGEALLPLPNLNPAYPQVDVNSTSAALLILGKLLEEGKGMSSLSVQAIAQAQADLKTLSAGQNAVRDFYVYVNSLLQAYTADKPMPFVLDLPDNATPGDLLSQAFIDCCGEQIDPKDDPKVDFLKKLRAATDAFHFQVCYSKAKIAVVFMADMSAGKKDGNCQAVNTFAWAKDEPGKQIYITGGVHKTTPICDSRRKTACLTLDQVDAINKKLANWVPNQLQMYDDGTHGDIVPGDSVYTISFELPYIPIKGSPDGRGVRLGYKYTYGHPGQGWTGSEEWPGNQRIIELQDMNGDGIVTRYDIFGDEAGNKDKANQLTPANGGCGVNLWETDKLTNCGHDTRENQIDTDGDCMPDSWPKPGNVSAITIPCK